jgi:hypothetical protein
MRDQRTDSPVVMVGRDGFVERIAAKLHDLANKRLVKECVLNLYGVPGIGKSTLLGHLATEAAKLEKVKPIIIYFDVTDVGQALEPAQQQCLTVLHAALEKIEAITELPKLPATLSSPEREQILATIVEQLIKLEKPLLVLSDTWERAPEALFSWFERHFLLPLVRSERLLAVLASQGTLRWRQFEVRRRVIAEQLQPLKPEDTAKQIGTDEEWGNEIFAYTFGHPLMNDAIYKEWKARGFPEMDSQAIKQLIADTDLIEVMYARIMDGVPDEVKQLLKILAIFREFDLHTIRNVVPQFHASFAQRSDSALLLSIKQLLDTKLVYWNDINRSYQLDPTIRQIFARALAQHKADHYQRVRAAARTYYADLVSTLKSNRNLYVVEYFYQQLCIYKDRISSYNEPTTEINKHDHPANTEAELSETLKSIALHYYYNPDGTYVDRESLAALRGRFATDEEIGALLQQLTLPDGLFTTTLTQLREPPLTEEDRQWRHEHPFFIPAAALSRKT